MKTEYGLPFEAAAQINENWNEYDRSVALAQLSNFGRIYIDVQYKKPIDNEYELEDCHETYEAAYPSVKNLKEENEELKAHIEKMQAAYANDLQRQQEQIEELMRIPKRLPFGLYQLFNSTMSLLGIVAPEIQITALEMKSDGLHATVSEHIHTLDPDSQRVVQELLDKLKKESLETCFICGRPVNPSLANYTDSELFLLCDECYERLDAANHPEKCYSLDEILAELENSFFPSL